MNPTTASGSAMAVCATLPSNEDAAGFDALTFVDIGFIEKIGSVGATYPKSEFQPLRGRKLKFKGSPDFGALTPSLAINDTDPGQQLLRTASDDRTGRLYPFQITYPDGARRWFLGQVFGMPETIDAADVIIIANPTVEICSEIIRAGPASDDVPNDFAFTSKTGVATDTDIASDPVQITGINIPTAISGGPYSVNGGAFISGTGTINPNDLVRALVHSSASPDIQTGTSVTIGGITRTFKVTTAASQTTLPVIALATATLSQAEGNGGVTNFVYTVNRTGSTAAASTVAWAVSGLAVSATDFVGGVLPSGTVTFPISSSSQTISIQVQGDVTAEADEAFTLTLSAPTNATLGTPTAIGTILNDDAGIATYDATLPALPLAYTGNDSNGYPLLNWSPRPSEVSAATDSIEMLSASLPGNVATGTSEVQPISGTAIEENGNLAFATLHSTAYAYFGIRLRRTVGGNVTYGPISTIVTNDTRAPTVTGGGATQATAAVTSGVESVPGSPGVNFAPSWTGNKPGLWAYVGPDAALFTAPTGYVSALAPTPIVTDFEAKQTYVVGAYFVDASGQTSNTTWFQHNVTNNTADDPVTSGWNASTASSTGILTVSSDKKTVTYTTPSAPVNMIGEVAHGSGDYWVEFHAHFASGSVVSPGLKNLATGEIMTWEPDSSNSGVGGNWSGGGWNGTDPRDAFIRFEVLRSVTGGGATPNGVIRGILNNGLTITKPMPTGWASIYPYVSLGYGSAGAYCIINTGQLSVSGATGSPWG